MANDVIGEVGSFITIPAGDLRATSPRFGTSINDTNGNELIDLTATSSAVNEFSIANAATGNPHAIASNTTNPNVSVSDGHANTSYAGNS